MSALPTFTPRELPAVQLGRRPAPDLNAILPCAGCGLKALRTDVVSGLCVDCWRTGPWAAAWALRGAALTIEGPPIVIELPPKVGSPKTGA